TAFFNTLVPLRVLVYRGLETPQRHERRTARQYRSATKKGAPHDHPGARRHANLSACSESSRRGRQCDRDARTLAGTALALAAQRAARWPELESNRTGSGGGGKERMPHAPGKRQRQVGA